MATGPEGSAYEEDGKRYRSALAKAGVEVQLRSTAGSVETAELLRDPRSGVSVGLMQGGVVGAANTAGLEFPVLCVGCSGSDTRNQDYGSLKCGRSVLPSSASPWNGTMQCCGCKQSQ
jgi:hypothetical protein